MTIAKAGGIGKKWSGFDIKVGFFTKITPSAHRLSDTLSTMDFIGYKRPRHAPYSHDLAPVDLSSSEI